LQSLEVFVKKAIPERFWQGIRLRFFNDISLLLQGGKKLENELPTHPSQNIFMSHLRILNPNHHTQKILCLHGGPGLDDSCFHPFLQPLCNKAAVVSYTQGFSGADTFLGLVREFADVVKNFASSELVILAHSFGAALLLQALAKGLIQSPKAVILSHWIFDQKIIMQHHLQNPVQENFSKFSIPQTDTQYRDNMLQSLPVFFSGEALPKGREVFLQMRYFSKIYQTVWKTGFADFDAKAVLPTLKIPVLSLASRNDWITPMAYVREGSALLPDPRFFLFEGGHFPWVEEPQKFCEVVADFI